MINQQMYQLGSKRSCIRDLFEYGLKRAAVVGKENVYDFSLGNPSIPAPEEVKDAFLSIVGQESPLAVHSYTPAPGAMDPRKAVADDLNARYDAGLRPENIYFTCGAAPALIAMIRALAVENAEIMAIAPFFPEYRPFVESSGAKLVVVPADEEAFQIRLDALEAALTPNTQAIIVNSPNNPSGVVYTRETLTALAAILTRKSEEFGHPIYILADEPYRELVYDGVEVPYIPGIYPNTVICYSYSKSLSLPGERIGYFCVPDCAADSADLFAAGAGAARIIGHVCAPSLQQLVVGRCAAIRPDLEAYDRNRTTLYEALTSYGYQCAKPNGAFYMFVRSPKGTAKEFSDRAKAKDVLIVPGGDFGCPNFFRISTCVDHDMLVRSLPIFKTLIEE